jgi:hypothetical protein
MRLLSSLVVDIVDSISKLRDLLLKDLLSHSITYTISVDDEVVRVKLLGVSL